eukprot:CAMPEP_0197657430 /NCGR_PEP_ID=MMETSP1338-20131121/44620_1 /TAXON_ID=43686 ORGANISM="Pelagodinium beii, Strain RCC1491" /NCGR_SAMPLE_ID=MMETSP1338 /ASSEMBLY_ACC=CAM_ASM_000754 /LENGTH=489 /DNA_ID=CAMNT_0043233797 /DNA_START=101 /DNA_END=1570 /DNA_ORIENTATION=+
MRLPGHVLLFVACRLSVSYALLGHERHNLHALSRSRGGAPDTDLGKPPPPVSSSELAFLWIEDTGEFIVGIVLVVLGVTGAYFFERQQARVDCLLSQGRSSCVRVDAAKVMPEATGKLVYLSGAVLRPEAPVQDPRFACNKLGTNCVRLRSRVQVFQWTEDGEGFQQKWSEAEQNSRALRDSGRVTAMPPGLSVGTTITNSGAVKYGSGFVVPSGLLDQCKSFRAASALLGPEVWSLDGQLRFLQHTDGNFYWRPGTRPWTAEDVAQDPQPGDARAFFEAVVPGMVTILALQADGHAGTAALLPYRLVPEDWWPDNDSRRRHSELLVLEGRKSRVGLAAEDQVWRGSRVCFCCNTVAGCCTGVVTAEIFKLYEGVQPFERCLSDVQKNASTLLGISTISFRLIAWLVLFFGLLMSISQVLISRSTFTALPFFDVFAFAGRIISCATFSIALCCLIVCCGNLPYKPTKSLMWFLSAICILLGPAILNHTH